MKMTTSSKSSVLFTGLRNAFVASLIFANSGSAQASSYTWNGSANSNASNGWATSTAWTSNGLPGAGDTVTFNGTGGTAATVTLGGSQSIGGITVATGETGTTTLTSGGTAGYTLTIGSGGITQAASTGTVTLGSTTAASNFTVVLGSSTNTQTWTNSSSAVMSVLANINGNSATQTQTLVTSGGAINISGVIGDGTTTADAANNIAITYGSTGTLTLSGANTFTGGVTVNSGAGTLLINSSTALGTGPLTINGGSLDSLPSVGAPLTVNVSTVNINGSFTYIGSQHSLTLVAPVTITNNDTISLSNVGLNLVGNVGFATTTNTLTKAGAGTLNFGGTSTVGGTWTASATNTITISAGDLTFNVANGTTIANNIVNNTSNTGGLQGLEASGVTNTFSGNITGTDAAGLFDQTGAGKSIITGTINGGVTIAAGTLNVGSSTALGSSGTIALTGGTLQYSAANTTDYSSRFSTAASQAYSIDTNGQNVTLASNLTSSGGTLSKAGAGTLTLSGTNSYGGANTISAGTLQLGSSTALGGTTGALTDNGTLDLNGFNAGVGALSGSGTITSSAAGNLTLTLGNTTSTTFSGIIQNGSATSLALVKNGTGTQTIYNSSSNPYTGGTTINAGAIALGSGSTPSSTTLNWLGTGSITINSGGALVLGYVGSTGTSYYLGSSTANAGNAVTFAGGSILTNDGLQHVTGPVNVTAASILGATYETKGLYIGGDLTGSGNLTIQYSGLTAGTSTTQSASIVHFNSADSASANTYTGTITITPGTASGSTTAGVEGDYLSIDGSTVFSNATVNLSGNNANAGAYGTQTLLFGTTAVTVGSLTGSGSTVLSETFNGSSAVALTVGANNAASDSYTGSLSGAGSLIKTGTGTFTLGGTQSYTGVTTVSGGTLSLTGTLGSGTGGGTAITSSGTLTETSAGVIAGTSSLSVTGGTTTLSGSNTYSGATSVSGGSLILTAAATSTETGVTTVNNGGTLQLQATNALQYTALTLNSGSTLQLRANTASSGTTTTFAPASIAAMSSASTLNFDVNNLLGGTGNTVALTGGLVFAGNTSNQINVTGGGGTSLALGSITNSGNAGGTYNFTINATTAPVSISSFTASSYGTNLIIEGGNNVTFGSSSTAAGTTTLTSNSNGYFTTNVTGGILTIYGTYITSGTGSKGLTLNSGQLNLDSAGASGNQLLSINGGTLDNTSGGSVTESYNPAVAINSSFTFAGSNALNLGTGGATINGTDTATISTNTLTIGGTTTITTGNTLVKAGAGTLVLSGTQMTGGSVSDTGAGGLSLGGMTILGTGNTFSNTGSGVLSIGVISNNNGTPTALGTGDFTTTATPTNLTTTGSNGSGNSTVISIMDTVNGGADFAAVGTGGAIVARNSIVAETALPTTGGSTSSVYYLTGSQTQGALVTVAALRINDTGTTDTLNVGTYGLTLGGAGGSGFMYNGGGHRQVHHLRHRLRRRRHRPLVQYQYLCRHAHHQRAPHRCGVAAPATIASTRVARGP